MEEVTYGPGQQMAFNAGRSIELARVINIIEDLRDNDMTSGCYEACFDRVLDAIDPRPEQVAT